MNHFRDIIDKVTSGDIPTGIMSSAGVVLLLLAMNVTKGFLKWIFVFLALAVLAGAVWWHFQQH